MSEQPRRRRRVPSEILDAASVTQQIVEPQPQKLAVSVENSSHGQVSAPRQQKKTVSPVFLVLIVIYFMLNMIDGATMWYNQILDNGWCNTILHSFLTLGAGPTKSRLRWGSVPEGIGLAFPGVLFAVFPLLTIVFANKGWKKPSCVMSVFNLLIALLCCACSLFDCWPLGVSWLLYLAASVLLLLDAMRIAKNRKKLASLFFCMGAASVVLFVVLSFFQVSRLNRTQFIGFSGLVRIFTNNWFMDYVTRGVYVGSYFNPLSRACLYGVFGVGLRDGSGVDDNSNYSLLEQYKREHGM